MSIALAGKPLIEIFLSFDNTTAPFFPKVTNEVLENLFNSSKAVSKFEEFENVFASSSLQNKKSILHSIHSNNLSLKLVTMKESDRLTAIFVSLFFAISIIFFVVSKLLSEETKYASR